MTHKKDDFSPMFAGAQDHLLWDPTPAFTQLVQKGQRFALAFFMGVYSIRQGAGRV